MDAFAGAIGVSDSDGKGTPVYLVCVPKSNANTHFYAHLIREMAREGWIQALSRGIRERSTDFRYDVFRTQFLPVPPVDEQIAIGRFLKHEHQRIDRVIRAKKRLIGLLNEQKQAIIHRAVTRGLNPNVPLKPSNLPWLGQIPHHWQVLRSKHIFREVDTRSATGLETHLSMSQKLGLIPHAELDGKRLISESYVGAKLCLPGDLVLNRLKAHLGVFALAPVAGLVSPDYTVFRPIVQIDPRYFLAVYRTPSCRVELRQRAKGIVQGFWRLYTPDFNDIKVPFPPLQEQHEIISRLDGDLERLNQAIETAEREISLLREYRTRLTADVVTGKLDVREAAAQLPDIEEPVRPGVEPTDEEGEEVLDDAEVSEA